MPRCYGASANTLGGCVDIVDQLCCHFENHLRKQSMLNLKDAISKRLGRISIENGDTFLRKNRPRVVLSVCQVNGYACLGISGIQDSPMHVQSVHPLSAIFREECGMDVYYSSCPVRHDPGRQLPHVAGKDNQVDVVGREGLKKIGLVSRGVFILRRRQPKRLNTVRIRVVECTRMGVVAYAERYLCWWILQL